MKVIEVIRKIFTYGAIILGLILVYQILRKAFWGSWTTENMVVTIVVLNLTATLILIGYIFTLTINFFQAKSEIKSDFHKSELELKSDLIVIKSDLKHLNAQFGSLAKDFKEYAHK